MKYCFIKFLNILNIRYPDKTLHGSSNIYIYRAKIKNDSESIKLISKHIQKTNYLKRYEKTVVNLDAFIRLWAVVVPNLQIYAIRRSVTSPIYSLKG